MYDSKGALVAGNRFSISPFTSIQSICFEKENIIVRFITSLLLPPSRDSIIAHEIRWFRILNDSKITESEWRIVESLATVDYLSALRHPKMICNLEYGFIHFANENELTSMYLFSLEIHSKQWIFTKRPSPCLGANIFVDKDRVYITCVGDAQFDFAMQIFNVSIPTFSNVSVPLEAQRLAIIPRMTKPVPYTISWRQCLLFFKNRFYCYSVTLAATIIQVLEMNSLNDKYVDS